MWDILIINPAINALLFIYTLVGQNFGVAIILFTIFIRLITHPLSAQQVRGTARMQELQKNPRWIEMQEKHKGNREALAQEQMKLYKELGINPFGQCLPLLLQFPIIIGLYQAIINAMANTPMEMYRLANRIYPGFIDLNDILPLNENFLWMDLGQPERLNLPFLPFGIPVLAILVAVTTYFQSKLITPPSANPNDQAARMTGMMTVYMPFFMGYLAWTFASGLALYFVISNVFTIGQYAMMGKANWAGMMFWRKQTPTPVLTAAKARSKPAPVRVEVEDDAIEDEDGERRLPYSSLSPQEKAEIRRKKRKTKKK
jgi:YidC/Oxa1 family membrane protein insertase